LLYVVNVLLNELALIDPLVQRIRVYLNWENYETGVTYVVISHLI